MGINQLIFGLAGILSISGVSSDNNIAISNNLVDTSSEDHKFEEEKHIGNLIAWKNWKEQKEWEDYCKTSEAYDHRCNEYIYRDDQLTRKQFDITDRQGESELMMMISMGIGFFGGVAAAVALVQNAQQTSDVDSLKSRVSSLESDQTNICTTVKSFQTASSGKTITGAYTDTTTTESGYLAALAAVTAPTCS